MIILIDKEKTFSEIKQSFMIHKYLRKPQIQGNLFNLVKSYYNKLLDNETLQTDNIRSETGILTVIFSTQHCLKAVARDNIPTEFRDK